MLPISSRQEGGAPFLDCLFTATSATCVTGLIVHDTATYWTLFGQFVILTLIQIGGMGIITIAVALTMISGRKIGLMQRSTMQNAISAPKVGGIVRLTKFITITSFYIELTGAVILFPIFTIELGGIPEGLWYAIFHSVSAFCNAGFDLMGFREPFSSLTYFSSNIIVNFTITSLIIVGGIGFFVWEDLAANRWHFRKYRMQTKVVLIMTALLLFLPTVYLYFTEYSHYEGFERFLVSYFQAVTLRTAGFNTASLSAISEVGIIVMVIFMLIGGSPGSTAGGIKTTTIAVLFASTIAVFRKNEDTNLFNRRVPTATIREASAIFILYITLLLAGSMIICFVEDLPFVTILFETSSAIATVGITQGITPSLGTLSKFILILLMYFGRVGGLTIIFAAMSGKKINVSRYPQEKITVG